MYEARVRWRVACRATRHVRIVGTLPSPNRILETYRSYREQNANRYCGRVAGTMAGPRASSSTSSTTSMASSTRVPPAQSSSHTFSSHTDVLSLQRERTRRVVQTARGTHSQKTRRSTASGIATSRTYSPNSTRSSRPSARAPLGETARSSARARRECVAF